MYITVCVCVCVTAYVYIYTVHTVVSARYTQYISSDFYPCTCKCRYSVTSSTFLLYCMYYAVPSPPCVAGVSLVFGGGGGGGVQVCSLPAVFMQREASEVRRGRPTVALAILQVGSLRGGHTLECELWP